MKRAKGINPPSNRDAIESWLDVLVSMLNLPSSQRDQVRDELEDHLRSRVDDLLIMGKPEPDAIQAAIHELGETAELAKLISSASRTRTPFRRFAMNATFFVLAGSIMTASISMMMPTSAHNATNTTITLSEEAAPIAAAAADPFQAFTIDVRNATFGELFDEIEAHADRPLIIHWDMLEEFGFSSDTPINIDSNPINAKLVFTILAERTEQVFYNSMAAFERPDRIEIGNQDQFDRRTTVKRIYDLSVFRQPSPPSTSRSSQTNNVFTPPTQNTVQRLMDLMQSHVSSRDWTSKGGALATSSVLNSTLVVTAPERMHEDIRVLLEELKAQHESQQREQHTQSREALDRIHAEYEVAKQKYLSKSNDYGRIELQGQQIEQHMEQGELSGPEFDKARAELGDLSLMLKELRLELQEQERRYESLQALLINAESDLIRAELN